MKPPPLNDNDNAVLGALGRAERPLSAYDILGEARSGALKAPVQVYRALDKLARRGLVHRIEALNAFVACTAHGEACRGPEHSHPRHRPAFVVCRACGAVREFEDRRVADIASAAAGSAFLVEEVSLEVYGRCARCPAAAG
jgi:Fur family zinc uptake transcriptional regulator